MYPTAREYDECFGVNGQSELVQVEVTDANGQVVTLKANASGKIYLRKSAGQPPIVYRSPRR